MVFLTCMFKTSAVHVIGWGGGHWTTGTGILSGADSPTPGKFYICWVLTYPAWHAKNSVAIDAWFCYWLITCKASVQPNQMRNRYVQAPYLSSGFGDLTSHRKTRNPDTSLFTYSAAQNCGIAPLRQREPGQSHIPQNRTHLRISPCDIPCGHHTD